MDYFAISKVRPGLWLPREMVACNYTVAVPCHPLAVADATDNDQSHFGPDGESSSRRMPNGFDCTHSLHVRSCPLSAPAA